MAKHKNAAAQALGRLGGLAAQGAGASAYWARLTPAERFAEMQRRSVVRAANIKARKKRN